MKWITEETAKHHVDCLLGDADTANEAGYLAFISIVQCWEIFWGVFFVTFEGGCRLSISFSETPTATEWTIPKAFFSSPLNMRKRNLKCQKEETEDIGWEKVNVSILAMNAWGMKFETQYCMQLDSVAFLWLPIGPSVSVTCENEMWKWI